MNILIAGGGIGGITAALCLARQGHTVEVFEQAHAFGEVGAGIQLSPNCTRVLHHLGLEPALRAAAFLPEGTEFRDWKHGRIINSNPLGHEVVTRYGFPYYHIHRGDLMTLLIEAAVGEARINLHTNALISEFESNVDGIELVTGGATHRADALIGADGIHSAVRRVLWGNETPRFTGNIAWRALVPADRLPAGLIHPTASVWWGPGKHFVHYYVRRGELVNCVCVVEKAGWTIESWTERGDYDELKSDFAGWHENVQTLIDQADRDSLYKWALYDRPPMPAWGKGRVTLLGDACHPTLPFMAQGAAMAIEDSAVLAACLQQTDDVTAALQHYESLRKRRTAGIQNGSRRNATVFHLSGIKAWLRNRAAKQAGGRVLDNLFSYNALDAVNK